MNILYIVRGVSGAGKTTLAKTLSHYVFSADDYFVNPVTGDYEFEASHLPAAHKRCSQRTDDAMQQDVPVIAVANTFTREWEMKGYYELAEKYGYMVFSIIVENRHGGVNVHGVPEKTLEQMKQRFEVVL